MNLIMVTAGILGLLIAGSYIAVFRRLVAVGRQLPAEDDWLEQVSVSRYRAMERLLDRREFEALASHPAFNHKMLRRFRAQRRRAFRGYLACLTRDYSRVCTAIKMVMVHSAQDRPDLAGLLMRQRVSFTFGLMTAHFRLALHGCGIGTVDVRELVAALGSVRFELNTLLLATQPTAA